MKGGHSQLRAMMFVGRQGLEKIDDGLGFDLNHLGNGPVFRELNQCIGAGVGVDAAAKGKGNRLDALVPDHQEYFQGIATAPALLAIAVRVFNAFMSIRTYSHFQVARGMILPKIKRFTI